MSIRKVRTKEIYESFTNQNYQVIRLIAVFLMFFRTMILLLI